MWIRLERRQVRLLVAGQQIHKKAKFTTVAEVTINTNNNFLILCTCNLSSNWKLSWSSISKITFFFLFINWGIIYCSGGGKNQHRSNICTNL